MSMEGRLCATHPRLPSWLCSRVPREFVAALGSLAVLASDPRVLGLVSWPPRLWRRPGPR